MNNQTPIRLLPQLLMLHDSTLGHVETMTNTIAKADGSRQPGANEPAQARCQGRRAASDAAKLHARISHPETTKQKPKNKP